MSRLKGSKLTAEHKEKIRQSLLGHSVSKETRRKFGSKLRGQKRTEETKRKISEALKKIGMGQWLKGKKLSEEHKNKIRKGVREVAKKWIKRVSVKCGQCKKEIFKLPSHIKKVRFTFCSKECLKKWVSENRTGKNAPNWNRGITPENFKVRNSQEFALWRDSIFKRDKFQCQECGDSSGGNLEAHHIYNFSDSSKLRFDIDNGITFCEECHRRFHKRYGYTRNDTNQLRDFLDLSVKISWYKYPGRGMSCNRLFDCQQWVLWFNDCVQVVRDADVDILKYKPKKKKIYENAHDEFYQEGHTLTIKKKPRNGAGKTNGKSSAS